jgi:hypothetical protein
MAKNKAAIWIAAIVAVVLVISLWHSVFGKGAGEKDEKKEGYGATDYKWFATDMLNQMPPQYRSATAAKVILLNVASLYGHAGKKYVDPLPCSTVCDYVAIENAFEGVDFVSDWSRRKSIDSLKRLLRAAHTENCEGGFVTFKEAADQVGTIAAGLV